jgi:hypothetical protein
MNKKLLSSTALVGALLVSGAALAEFKVGADVTATYSLGSDKNTSGVGSGERIGNETNLLLSGSQALSNGWTASYSGRLEFDGPATTLSSTDTLGGNPDHEYELKIGTADAYFAFANDGGQSNRTSMTPFVSYPIGSTAVAVSPSAPAFNGDAYLGAVHQSNNIAVGGKIGSGNIVLRYAPSTTGIEGNDVDPINADTASYLGATDVYKGSGYLLAYNGKFGPVGLNLGYTVEQVADESATTANDDAKEKRIGLVYNIGAVKLGGDYITFTSGEAAGAKDHKTHILGAAYAVDPKLTIGAYYQKTTDEADAATTAQDEELKMISIGYNLGAASIALSVIDIEGLDAPAASAKADYQGLMITTKVGF